MIFKLATLAVVGLVGLGVVLGGFTVMSVAASQKVDKPTDEYDAPIMWEDLFGYDPLSMEFIPYDAAKLEQFLDYKAPGCLLESSMQSLIDICSENNINPALILGIGWAETSLGIDPAAAVGVDKNLFGWGGKSYANAWDIFPEIVPGLRQNYIDAGFNEWPTLYGKYVPPESSSSITVEQARAFGEQMMNSDPAGNWVVRVQTVMTEAFTNYGGFSPLIVASGDEAAIRQAFVDLAVSYVGYPYEIPAYPPQSFNCSVLVDYCFTQVTGKQALPAPSRAQAAILNAFNYSGDIQSALAQMQPGDIIFDRGASSIGGQANPPPGHVGIYIGGGQMVEAKGHAFGVIISDFSADTDFWNWGSLSLVIGDQ